MEICESPPLASSSATVVCAAFLLDLSLFYAKLLLRLLSDGILNDSVYFVCPASSSAWRGVYILLRSRLAPFLAPPHKCRLIASISHSHALSLILYFLIHPEVPFEAEFCPWKRRCAANERMEKVQSSVFRGVALFVVRRRTINHALPCRKMMK